jgi:PEGA domain-containing protein
MLWGAMTSSRRRRNDPFLPPGGEERAPDLVDLPRRADPTMAQAQPPSTSAPGPRKPLKYKRPATSWVTVVVLAFAAVGMAVVGGTVIKKVTGRDVLSPGEKAEKAVTYSALAKDDAVLITVEVLPREAHILLDGEQAASNPLRILRSKTRHTVSAAAPGYATAVAEVVPDASKTVRLILKQQR